MSTPASTPAAPESAAPAGGGVRSGRRWHVWRSTPWWGGLFIVVIVALAAFDVWRGHANAVAETGRELDALSRVIAEQTARSLQTVDRVTLHVADEFRAGKLDGLDEVALHAYLREQVVGLVQVAGLSIIDADGHIRASSSRLPVSVVKNSVAELPAFQQLKARRDSGMLVAGAMRGISRPGSWMFPMGRRLEHADGRFAGAIAAAGRVEYFQNFYHDVRLDPGTKITLMHRDGTLVARHPPVEEWLGKRFALIEAVVGARAEGQVAPARMRSPLDGVERFGAVQLLAEYPLAVVVARDADVALAPWRAEHTGTALRTLALGMLATVLLWTVRRQFDRLDRTRESLELSRERFALAAAGSDEGIWDWDLVGDRVYASARARAVFGLPPGPDVQPRADWFASVRMHPDDVAGRREALQAHLAGQTPVYAGEYRVMHPDGGYRWVRVRGLCVRDAQGEPLRMAGSVTDIDARRRAEDALRLSEERYALAMTGSTGGHWVWEPTTDALFVSGTVNQLFGLPVDLQPATQKEYFAQVRLHPDDLVQVAQLRRDVDDPAVTRLDFECRIQLPGSDAVRWIHTRAQCFRDDTGQALRVAGVSVDITERKRTEEALRLSEERFALAAAGSKDGIIDWDIVGDRMYTSERMLQMIGAPTDTTVRTRAEWMQLLQLHPDDRERHARELQAFLDSREVLREGEYRLRRPDGEWFWVRLRNLCVRAADGRPQRLAGSVSDIDAYKRVEAALRESEERYALAMTGSNEGHWVWDIATDAMYASRKLNELLRLPPEVELTTYTRYLERLPIHPDDRQRVAQARIAHIEGRTPKLDVEYRIIVPGSGEVRWMHSRGQCFRDTAGRAIRLAGSTADVTDRKNSEQALRASEERFALAVAGSDDGVWDWDFVAGMAFESARARQLQGLPPGPDLQPLQVLVDSLRVHPDDVPLRAEGIRAHLAGETPAYECEYRVRHDDGQYRWIRVRALCIRDEHGKPVRMAGSVSDVDARKRAEQALRESEQRFALAVAGSNDGILDWDIVADRMYVSERARQICGVDPDARFSTRDEWAALIMPRFHPDDVPRIVEQLRERDGQGLPQSHDGEYRMRDAAGEYRWVRFRGMSVLDEGGRPRRWAGSVSDIDAQKKTEEALRRSEQRYQLAVDGSNEGLWDWDLASDSIFLSPRAQHLLWQRVGEHQRPRRDWIAITDYHPDDMPTVRAALSAHLHGASRHFKVEFRLRNHSGEWRWYSQRGVAVRDAAGRPTRMAGSMEDITERKHTEAERERLEAQLRQAQKLEAIGTLAGGIAHDFNNILAAILGYGEMAQKDAPEGTALRRNIDAAMSAGMRAKSLVERILAFSRSGMGERLPVHVESVVTEALDAVAASLPPGIRLERELACGNAAVLGDPTQVHQVVLNLCANAVQAMKSSGTLSVTLDQLELQAPRCATSVLADGNYVRLRVRDTGSGIAPELVDRIFDPFFTTKEVGVGTGLGLSLVHGIVTDLGGGIDVQSSIGEGTLFTVYLPWQSCTQPPQAVEESVPAGNGETVLLVDDEESLVRLGEEMIAGLGYEPVGFTSSRAALETFRASPGRFDMILSDEAMPEMTGSELALAIRAIRGDIPIVLMSGYVTPAMTLRARDAGVLEMLAKPLVARDIARSLAGALQRQT
jgi:PAS domain S-box-containing protein